MPIRARVECLGVLLVISMMVVDMKSSTKLVFCFLGSAEAFFLESLPLCLALFAGSSRLEAAGRFLPMIARCGYIECSSVEDFLTWTLRQGRDYFDVWLERREKS